MVEPYLLKAWFAVFMLSYHCKSDHVRSPGAWETKVSNREKRQQRKKERGPDDSGSPGGEAPKTHLEGPGVKTSKKNKGNRGV